MSNKSLFNQPTERSDFMKLYEAIARADIIRPNAIPEDIKASFIYELEGEFAEMMKVEVPKNPYPNVMESDKDLLMPYPKDNVYALYLCAMIDSINEETNLYQNDMMIANTAIKEARQWWWRNFAPKSHKYVKLNSKGVINFDTSTVTEQSAEEGESDIQVEGD